MENVTPEQIENTTKQIRQGKKVNQQIKTLKWRNIKKIQGVCQKKEKNLTQKQRNERGNIKTNNSNEKHRY